MVPEDQQPLVARPKLQVPTALPAPARPAVPQDAPASPSESAELKESPGPAAPTAATEAPSTPTAEATPETSTPEEGAKRKGGRRKKGAAGPGSLGKRKKKATLVDETAEAPAASESGAASETPPSALPSQEGSEHDTTSASEEPPSDAEPAVGPSSSGDGDS